MPANLPASCTIDPPEDIFARPYVQALLGRIQEQDARKTRRQNVWRIYDTAKGLVDRGWTFAQAARYLSQVVGLKNCNGGAITAKYLSNLFGIMRRRL